MPVVTVMPAPGGRSTRRTAIFFGIGQVFAVGVLHIFDSVFHAPAPPSET